MNEAQAHRGPDGEGFYLETATPALEYAYSAKLEEPALCGLAHRRLAILDPAGGAQPMTDADGDVVVLFNGEIYNFAGIRRELEREGCRFRTDTDTEIIPYLYRKHPDDPAAWLRRLNGIFAIALWDRKRRRLLLARDPYGVKPLHYARHDGAFCFASEIKSILAAGMPAALNRAALHVFMNIRYVPGSETLFAGVRRLPPAHFAVIEDAGVCACERYYSLPRDGFEGGRVEAVQASRRVFQEAVERQMLSDVPLGMALSGGLDSSMIVAAAADAYGGTGELRTADRILRTFTLGLNEPTDENEDARRVADLFSAEHHDLKLSMNPLDEMRAVIRAVEEPKINIMQGYALARFIREHVKVYFGGLGGDELFAGYDIHRFCNTLGRLHGLVPVSVHKALLAPISRGAWALQNSLPEMGTELYRIGAQIALSAGDRAQFYCRLRNAWDGDAGMFSRVYADPEAFRAMPGTTSYFASFFQEGGPYLEQVLRAEFQTKMVNDFLVNEDRASSAHGVESRVPFLDRELVELAFRIPAGWKMRGTETKRLWKEAVSGCLPGDVLRKKKHGFTFSSYHQWQKDLRPTVERELSREWCEDTKLFNYDFVHQLLEHKPRASMRWHYFMAWMMLGFKEWMEVFDVRC
jgi:asparagine synthase (glutamine-hydrolysing)